MRNFRIKVLMYGDDNVLLAKTPIKLQIMITKLEEYSKMWNPTIHRSRSQIMVFGRGKRQRHGNYMWSYEREPVEIVEHYY